MTLPSGLGCLTLIAVFLGGLITGSLCLAPVPHQPTAASPGPPGLNPPLSTPGSASAAGSERGRFIFCADYTERDGSFQIIGPLSTIQDGQAFAYVAQLREPASAPSLAFIVARQTPPSSGETVVAQNQIPITDPNSNSLVARVPAGGFILGVSQPTPVVFRVYRAQTTVVLAEGVLTVLPASSTPPRSTSMEPRAVPASDLGQTYRHPSDAYALSYPPDWQIAVADRHTLRLVRGGSAGTISLRLVYYPTLPQEVGDSSTLWRALLPQIQAEVDDFQLLKADQPATLGGEPASGALATWTTDATPMQANIAVLAREGQGYLLQQVAPVHFFQREAPGLEMIAATIRFS